MSRSIFLASICLISIVLSGGYQPAFAAITSIFVEDGTEYYISPTTGRKCLFVTIPIQTGPPMPDGAYELTIVEGQEVYMPSPAAAAGGDVSNKKQFVGEQKSIVVPGGVLVQLANGTWVNEQASDYLAGKYELVNSTPPPNGFTPIPTDGNRYKDFDTYEDPPGSGTGYMIKQCGFWNHYSNYGSNQGHPFYDFLALIDFEDIGGGQWRKKNAFSPIYYNISVRADGIKGDFDEWRIFIADPYTPPPQPEYPTIGKRLESAIGAEGLADFENNGLRGDFGKILRNADIESWSNSPVVGQSAIDNYVAGNAAAVEAAIAAGIAAGVAQSTTDGSNTGSAQVSSAQNTAMLNALNGIKSGINENNTALDGIQDKLDEIDNDLKTNGTYSPESISNDYASDTSLNKTSQFTDRFSSFVTSVKATPLFSLPSQILCNIPNSSTSIFTIDMGSYGSADIDFASFGTSLTIFRTALLICFAYASIRIAATGK